MAATDSTLISRFDITWASGTEPPEAASIRLALQSQNAAVQAAKSLQETGGTSVAPAFAAGAVSSSIKATNGTPRTNHSQKTDEFEDMILQQMMSKS